MLRQSASQVNAKVLSVVHTYGHN